MNWRVFRACWRVAFDRYLWSIRTPWFQVLLSSGATEWSTCGRWYGLRVYWDHAKNWQCEDGGILFYSGDNFLSFREYELQREYKC